MARAWTSSTRRRGAAALAALGAATALLAPAACGAPKTPAPPLVQQPTSALVPVPYPPPPARAEVVPDPPREDAVWVDGEWVWQGGRWAWRAGRWVVVPPGVAFAPWTTVRGSNGALHAAEGTFRDAQGRAVPEPKALGTGKARGGGVVDPEGEPIPPSPPAEPRLADSGEGASAVSGPDDTTPAGGAFVDANLLPGPAPRQFPDAATPLDAAVPEWRREDGGMLLDATVRPLAETRGRIDAP